MSTIVRAWSLPVALEYYDSHRVVGDRLALAGATIKQHDQYAVVATAGSQVALRIKGGWLCQPQDFPVEMTIRAVPLAPGQSRADIGVRDTLGIGLMMGMQRKYNEAIDGWCATIQSALAPWIQYG